MSKSREELTKSALNDQYAPNVADEKNKDEDKSDDIAYSEKETTTEKSATLKEGEEVQTDAEGKEIYRGPARDVKAEDGGKGGER